MTDFYAKLHVKHSPELSKAQFSEAINHVEGELFDACPFLLELPVKQQNEVVEFVYAWRK